MSKQMEDPFVNKLRDKLNQAEFNPPAHVLQSLEKQFPANTPPRSKAIKKSSYYTIGLIAGLAILTLTYFQFSKPDQPEALTPIMVQKQPSVAPEKEISAKEPNSNAPANDSHAKDQYQINTDNSQKSTILNPFAGENIEICGNSTQLNARHSNHLSIGRWYSESKSIEFISNNFAKPEEDPSATIIVSEYGVYKLRWTETLEKKQAFDELTVHFKEVPQIELEDSKRVCGYEIELSSGGKSGFWSTQSDLMIAEPYQSITKISSVKLGKYELTWTEELAGCTKSDTIIINFQNNPLAQIQVLQEAKCSYSPVILTTDYIDTYKYTWEFNNALVETIDNRTYSLTWPSEIPQAISLTVESPNSCINQIQLDIHLPPKVMAVFNHALEQESIPAMAYFTNKSMLNNSIDNESMLDYYWDFGDGHSSTQKHPDHLYTAPGIYSVKMIANDQNSCADTSAVQKIQIKSESKYELAKYFTPNGDNINDYFIFQSDQVESFVGVILNAKGEKIYEWTEMEIGWDGNLRTGNPAAEGAYYYIIRGIDQFGKRFEVPGLVYLLRD